MLLGCRAREYPIRKRYIKSGSPFRRKPPRLIRKLSKILRRSQTRNEKRRGYRQFRDEKRSQEAPCATIQGRAASGRAQGSAKIRPRGPHCRKETKPQPN